MFDFVSFSGWGAAIYFVSLVLLGNFILLNLFLAILLNNFSEPDEEENKEEEEYPADFEDYIATVDNEELQKVVNLYAN